MANALYDPGREGILDESINMNSGDIRVMLVQSTYTYSAAHKFLSDMGSVDSGRTTGLTSKTFTNGVFDAADITLTSTGSAACNALVIFKHTGSDATARLVCYLDTYVSGLPATPAVGQTAQITWDNGSNKIFKL